VACRKLLIFVFACIWMSASVIAVRSAEPFRLSVPQDLNDSGFLKYLLPRFSLKTNTRIELVSPEDPAEVRLLDEDGGTPVFEGLDRTWYASVEQETGGTKRFMEWLTGDVGRRTIDGFPAKDGVEFTAAAPIAKEVDDGLIAGDAGKGEKLAVVHCGRCHRVNAATRMAGIGSTPSFAILRTLADWKPRFEAFFALNPHPSFTLIEDVTEPFDETRPPPIVPVEMTLDDLDAILAFVSRIPPADLGAPLQYQ
jgi:hypothetical protein